MTSEGSTLDDVTTTADDVTKINYDVDKYYGDVTDYCVLRYGMSTFHHSLRRFDRNLCRSVIANDAEVGACFDHKL